MALKNISDIEMVTWIRGKMDACETEIKYIEELLCATTGPADDLVIDLEVNKRRLVEFQVAMGAVMMKMKSKADA